VIYIQRVAWRVRAVLHVARARTAQGCVRKRNATRTREHSNLKHHESNDVEEEEVCPAPPSVPQGLQWVLHDLIEERGRGEREKGEKGGGRREIEKRQREGKVV
jgi:hypothetical protein